MNIKEFDIPVPWGYIAVKAWGEEKNPTVLMIHGLYDNAGSFDRLIPLLHNTYYYVCIDFPGHGKSSYYPPFMPLHTVTMLLTFKIILDYLQKKNVIIISHSWGGQMSIMFAQMYPHYVCKLIMIDAVYYFPLTVNYFKSHMKDRVDQIMKTYKTLSTKSPRVYMYDEILKKLQYSRYYGPLVKDAAKALANRCLISVGDGKYRISTDIRFRSALNTQYDEEFFIKLIKKYPVVCPLLIIVAKDSFPTLIHMKSIIKELQKQRCTIKLVDGDHDVHTNEPGKVAPIINNFLSNTSNKL